MGGQSPLTVWRLTFADAKLGHVQTILHYLVGSNFVSKPSEAVLEMLKSSGLMSGTARQLKITSKGFQFLLEDVNSQLWGILLRYLDGAEEKSMDTVEVLAFLFMLGSLELGRVRISFMHDWASY